MRFLYHTKINHTKHLTDARFAAAAGIHYLGFCFDNTSPAFIPPIKAKEIIDWTSGSHIVGEFGNQSVQDINTIVQLLNIDIVELQETFSENISDIQVPVILTIDLEKYSPTALLHLCTQHEQQVQAFHFINWEKVALNNPEIFAKIGIEFIVKLRGNLIEQLSMLSVIKPFGVSFDGDSEEKAGMKDFEILSDFLEQIVVQE